MEKENEEKRTPLAAQDIHRPMIAKSDFEINVNKLIPEKIKKQQAFGTVF